MKTLITALIALVCLTVWATAPTEPDTNPPEFPDGVKTIHLLVMCCDELGDEWTQCNGFYVVVGADTQFYKLEVDK